ncbi:hypothetical protein LINGRAHAP2_LOCUS32260 [Linum grandiflorum]
MVIGGEFEHYYVFLIDYNDRQYILLDIMKNGDFYVSYPLPSLA